MKIAIHYYGDNFEVEARTEARLEQLIKAECHDRGWLVEDTEREVVE